MTSSIVSKVFSRLRHEIYRGTYKDRTLTQSAIRRLVQNEECTILEIGAADGLDTQRFLNTFTSPEFRIIAFEPEPRNIEKFQNNISDPRAALVKAAIGAKPGRQTFHLSSTEYSSSLREPNVAEFKEKWPEIDWLEPIEVEVVSLDSIAADMNLTQIDFVWADVQGAEDLMIEGGRRTLNSRVKFLYTEYSDTEYYKNEPDLTRIKHMLGDSWVEMANYGSDVLFRNVTLT